MKDLFYGYASWAVFLPVAAALAGGIWRVCRETEKEPGSRAVFALSFYGAVRILYESLRQDDIPKWGFVRVNQILSAVLLLILLILCRRGSGRGLGKSAALFAGGVILAGAMEFALEKKIVFLEFMPMDTCYVVMGLSCLGMTRSVLPMVHRMET